MNRTNDDPRPIIDAMLAMAGSADAGVAADTNSLVVMIAGETIAFGDGSNYPFERLALAIEARITYRRACTMRAATGEKGVPTWLVVGSAMLGRWLEWSRLTKTFTNALELTDRIGLAPVAGDLGRRARHDLGQLAIRVRVRGGQAVAERIEFSHSSAAVGVLGDRAFVRLPGNALPDTLRSAFERDPRASEGLRLAEIVDHPFFAQHDFRVAGARNEGDAAVFEIETKWQPLSPIPEAAWTVAPRDADPVFPWRATAREVDGLYTLARRGEGLSGGDG